MENVTDLKPDGEDFRWYIKLKCDNCGEETLDFVYCTLIENCPLKGDRGHASLVFKCKLCKRENSIDIVKDSMSTYTADDAGSYKTIVKFDCRGTSPTEYSPRVGWTSQGTESNTHFNVDLKEKEWYDYDEEGGQSVSISEVSFQFVHVKH